MASDLRAQERGSLSEMAVDGTTVPEDAARPNTIQSVPRPGQGMESHDLGSADLATAVDNAQDISRTVKDSAPTDTVITGTGDTLPSEIGSKRLHNVPNQDLSKGHPRFEKHVAQKGSDQEQGASEGAREDEVIDGVIGGRP